MKKLAALLVVVAGLALGALYVVRSEPPWFERVRYPLRYQAIVRGHAHNYRLDPALLAAVIYQESKFDANARSSSGAIGLMQLLPATAEGIALHTGGTRFRLSDLDNPELNVRYGSWYLRHLREHYHGLPDATTLALAAYNAGMANVDSWVAKTRPGQPLQIPPAFAETRHYLDGIKHARSVYRRLYPGELGLTK